MVESQAEGGARMSAAGLTRYTDRRGRGWDGGAEGGGTACGSKNNLVDRWNVFFCLPSLKIIVS